MLHAVEQAAGSLLADFAHDGAVVEVVVRLATAHAIDGDPFSVLLVVEGRAQLDAGVSQVAHPGWIPWAGVGSALEAADNPVWQQLDRDGADVAQQRLSAPEAHARRHGLQLRAITQHFLAVHDGGAEPDIRGELGAKVGEHARDVADALGQQQPVEIRCRRDQVEQVGAPGRINLVVEHVGQAGAEDAAAGGVQLAFAVRAADADVAPRLRLLASVAASALVERTRVPALRQVPVLLAGAHARVARPPHDFVVAGVHQVLGVAVIAAGADLRAPHPWVERRVSPGDFSLFRHG